MEPLNITSFLITAVLLLAAAVFALLFFHGRQIRRYKNMALCDPLTGCLTRIGFLHKADRILCDSPNQYAVVTLQIRNYRHLVTAFGTEKADQALISLSEILKSNLSAAEPAARVSNDRFCFLLKNRQNDAIRTRLTRIHEAAGQLDRKSHIPCIPDLYFGILTPEGSAENLSELLETSAVFLETCSEETRYHFIQNRREDAPSRKLERVRQIECSLENGEFTVFLHPKVRLSDNLIAGAEAQLRWKHPQRGMLTSEMYVPLLEEYRLIPKYDQYLFEQVCRIIAQWMKMNWTPCPISIRLSYDTLMSPRFVEHYSQICRRYGVNPELIEFELHESVQNHAPAEIYAVVEEIHAFSFRCALAGFGKTRLPLHFLRELNIDTIKLDRILFASENNNRRNRFAVDAVLKLATQMQIRTVAEGIDNASQVQYLKQAGCDLVQAFYYFLPMPVEEFCLRAYQKGNLSYVNDSGVQSAQANLPAKSPASSKITMFSLQTLSDQVIFSTLFSPVQEGNYVISNATALFQFSDLIHENDRKDFFRLLERSQKESGWVENTIRFYTGKDRYEWLEVHMHREASGDGSIISGTLINMTGWKNEVNRWKEKANRDALTGLYNREYFEQTANSTLEKGTLSTAAIIFVDIDDFKKVNDTLGHMVGDDVICSIAKRLLGTFRHSDVVARYGGDEFVVFVNGISREDLTKRLQQLCDSFRFPYRNDTVEYPVSTSIGAAMFPQDGEGYLQLLDHADSALYVAKRQGKNQFVFYHPDYEGLSE